MCCSGSFVEYSVQLWYKGWVDLDQLLERSVMLWYRPISIADCHRVRCPSLNHQRYLHRCKHVVCQKGLWKCYVEIRFGQSRLRTGVETVLWTGY